jgi:hypothetical protein
MQMKKLLILAAFVAIGVTGLHAQHTLVLKSGEKMNGEVKSLNNGEIKFNFKGNEMTFKVAEVSSLLFDQGAAIVAVNDTKTTSAKGVSYDMAGRKMTKPPKVDNLTMEKGIVVVEITINKYGNVIKAVPGIEGSTTTSKYLLTKAQQAAQSVMFDTSPVMPLEQKGSITITF